MSADSDDCVSTAGYYRDDPAAEVSALRRQGRAAGERIEELEAENARLCEAIKEAIEQLKDDRPRAAAMTLGLAISR